MRDLVATFPLGGSEGEAFTAASGRGVWVEGLGLVTVAATGSAHAFDLYAVQLDGRAVRLGLPAYHGLGWVAPTPTTGAESFAAYRDTGWRALYLPGAVPKHAADVGCPFDWPCFGVMPDRALGYATGRISRASWGSGYTQPEATLDAGAGTGTGSIAPAIALAATRALWWAIDLPTGRVRLYDAIAKQEIASGRTALAPGLTAAAYSRKLDLFVAIQGSAVLVYVNEPAAATVSAPTLSAPLAAGAARKLSARVLGADGEPCVERVVEFEASAGTTERAAVATDASGTAATTYQAPFAGAASVTITATLRE